MCLDCPLHPDRSLERIEQWIVSRFHHPEHFGSELLDFVVVPRVVNEVVPRTRILLVVIELFGHTVLEEFDAVGDGLIGPDESVRNEDEENAAFLRIQRYLLVGGGVLGDA